MFESYKDSFSYFDFTKSTDIISESDRMLETLEQKRILTFANNENFYTEAQFMPLHPLQDRIFAEHASAQKSASSSHRLPIYLEK